jgi:hypothetical protein
MCTGTKKVTLCTVDGDCTNAGTGYNLCCTFGSDGGGSLSFCANDVVASGGGGTCH